MKVRFVPIMLALALSGLTSPARAQEERGQLWDVQTISVRPDHIDEFMEAAGLLRAAAEAAKLSAEYGWHMWIQGFDVAIASMAPDMASFDDPEAWIRAFQGTAGEEMMNEAMGRFMTKIAAQPSIREVYEQVEAWSYAPPNPTFEDPTFAQRFDFWIKPGMSEQFEKVARDISAFQAELGGPYPVNGYRIHFGDTGRVTLLVFNDGWGDFYGKNDMEAQMEYIADLSYPGPGT